MPTLKSTQFIVALNQRDMSGELAALTALNGFLGKSDGKDKLTATLQYVCMFVSAGQPGLAKDIQVKIAAARKVFRILKPLEVLTPIIKEPYLAGKQHPLIELLPKLKNALMAVYFGCDHLVWLGSVNVITDKKFLERSQKTSLWGWFLGSICTMIQETISLLQNASQRQPQESEEDWKRRRHAAAEKAQKHILTLTHAIFQGLLAMGLLQLRPFKPRTVGLLGVIASAMNCYMLFPAIPRVQTLTDLSKPAAEPAKPAGKLA